MLLSINALDFVRLLKGAKVDMSRCEHFSGSILAAYANELGVGFNDAEEKSSL